MLLRSVLLPSVLLPIAVTAVALLLLRAGRSEAPRGASAIAIAAGFLAGFVAISGWPRWPPVEATQRIFFLVAVAAVASAFATRWQRGWVRRATAGLAIGLLLLLVLQTPLQRSWSPWMAALWLAGLFVVMFAVTRALTGHLEEERAGIMPALVRLALLVGIAVSLGLSDSLRLALLAGALAASVAIVEMASWRGLVGRSPAEALLMTLCVGGLLLVGYFFAGLDLWPVVLLTIALLLLRLPGPPTLWRRLLPLLPLLLALALVIVGFLQAEEDPYDYYGAAEPRVVNAART